MNKVYKSNEGKMAVLDIYDRVLKTSALEISSLSIPTSLGETHVFQYGNPEYPPLLLIHGTGSNAASFLYALRELGKKYHVYLPDIPGEPGKSEDKRFACEGGGFSQWIYELMDALALENVNLGGQSLGAWASLRFAIDHPQRVKTVLLISPSGLATVRGGYLFRLLFSLIKGDRGIKSLIRKLHNSSEDMIDKTELEVFRLLMKHCRFREDQPPLFTDQELQAVKAPLLYIGGTKDILLNTGKSAERIKKLIPEAECIIYPEGGHALTSWIKEFTAFDS